MRKKENTDIIISWRIGDSISTIPMLVCLKQLNQKHNSNIQYKIICQPFLAKLLSQLNIFDCEAMNFATKAKSNLLPPDKAFFLETTNKNYGYSSKKSYGMTNEHKKFLIFSKELPFLNINDLENTLPSNLIEFLSKEIQLSRYSQSLFGVCLEQGYTADEIIETFNFHQDSVDLSNFEQKPHDEKYIIICMEAAYGRKGDAYRCWSENKYFQIADNVFENFGIKSKFIGVDNTVSLPNKEYYTDLRGKLNLFELAKVIKNTVCYAGNDTGPLHIANLMQTPSVSIYFEKHTMTDFSPIFSDLNTPICAPQNENDFQKALFQLILNIYGN